MPERAGALGAERALVHRAARVALDVDRLAVLGVDQLRAADGAERADAGADRSASSSRGRSVLDVVLLAASAITLSPASWRGMVQSRRKPLRPVGQRSRSFVLRAVIAAPPGRIRHACADRRWSGRASVRRDCDATVRRRWRVGYSSRTAGGGAMAEHGRRRHHRAGGPLPADRRPRRGAPVHPRPTPPAEPASLPPLAAAAGAGAGATTRGRAT